MFLYILQQKRFYKYNRRTQATTSGVPVQCSHGVCVCVQREKEAVVLKQPIQHIANEPNTSSHKNNMLGHKFNATNIEHSLNFYSLYGLGEM